MLNKLINRWTKRIMNSRPPDVVIGEPGDPYLLRWWVWPRNKFFNLYLHRVLKSDDDRALHDHPWVNMSYLVEGGYYEVTPEGTTWREAGAFKWRLPTALHRLMLKDQIEYVNGGNGNVLEVESPQECTTLFLTGPRVRTWGFQCPKGWVKWMDFTQKTPEGTRVARACGDIDPQLLHPQAAPSGWRVK